jgi:hypothetical protein
MYPLLRESVALQTTLMLYFPAAGSKSLLTLLPPGGAFRFYSSQNVYPLCSVTKLASQMGQIFWRLTGFCFSPPGRRRSGPW